MKIKMKIIYYIMSCVECHFNFTFFYYLFEFEMYILVVILNSFYINLDIKNTFFYIYFTVRKIFFKTTLLIF